MVTVQDGGFMAFREPNPCVSVPEPKEKNHTLRIFIYWPTPSPV